MSILEKQIQNYLKGDTFYLDENLWLAYSNIGIHWSELPIDVLASFGDGILTKIEKGIKELKKSERYLQIKCYLAEIEKCNGKRMNGYDLEMYRKLNFTKEEILTVFFENIHKNFNKKRDFRVHLCGSIPLSIYFYGKGVESEKAELMSASKGGLFFSCDNRLQSKFDKSKKVEMGIQPHDLFEINKLLEQNFKPQTTVPNFKFSWNFSIDTSQVQFMSSQLFCAVNLEGPYDRLKYFYVPYTAIKDSMELGESCIGITVDRYLDEIEEITLPR